MIGPAAGLDDAVRDLEPGQVVVATLALGAGRTIVLPRVQLLAGREQALALAGFGGLTPYVRYADGSVPPYLLDVEVLGA